MSKNQAETEIGVITSLKRSIKAAPCFHEIVEIKCEQNNLEEWGIVGKYGEMSLNQREQPPP